MPIQAVQHLSIPSVYMTLLSVTRSPRPSLLYSHTERDQILEVVKAWNEAKAN